jgi:hypothetical protein
MSITSFSKPSDNEILQNIIEKDSAISFVGKGSVLQNAHETLYVRIVKIELEKEEVLQKVIYIKKGIAWFFKTIEILVPINDSAVKKE